MTAYLEQDCPLCHRLATFSTLDRGHCKHFECSHCNEFIISRHAEAKLPQSLDEWKVKLAFIAKRSNGKKIILIKLNNYKAEAVEGEQVFITKLVPRPKFGLW